MCRRQAGTASTGIATASIGGSGGAAADVGVGVSASACACTGSSEGRRRGGEGRFARFARPSSPASTVLPQPSLQVPSLGPFLPPNSLVQHLAPRPVRLLGIVLEPPDYDRRPRVDVGRSRSSGNSSSGCVVWG